MPDDHLLALPKGIITVLNTPFDNSGLVDLTDLQRHVQYAMRAGVSGFLVPAMASETNTLSEKEKLEIIASVLETAGDKVPVIAGAGGSDISTSKVLTAKYLELGCSHILYQFPYENENKFRSQVLEVADSPCKCFILQDWQTNGYGIPDELILELFESVDAFKGIKIETVPAGIKYSRILECTGGALHVSGGWAVTQMIEGLMRGVHAFMPTGMHFVYTEIYRRYLSGGIRDAESLFYRLLPILAFSNQHLDISIHFFKRLLVRQGIYKNDHVRMKGLGFDRIHEEIAEKLIGKAISLEREIEKDRQEL
jgi:4-hydroxy-tetrahydrodipicolinate synthase